MRRNKSTFPHVGILVCRDASAMARRSTSFVAISGQILQLFQMDRGIDKIPRRSANCGNKRLFGLTYH
jgi:hypothetical protein